MGEEEIIKCNVCGKISDALPDKGNQHSWNSSVSMVSNSHRLNHKYYLCICEDCCDEVGIMSSQQLIAFFKLIVAARKQNKAQQELERIL